MVKKRGKKFHPNPSLVGTSVSMQTCTESVRLRVAVLGALSYLPWGPSMKEMLAGLDHC